MVALDYVAMVLIAISIIVNALAQIGESSDGDDNVPHQDHFISVPFYLLIIIGYAAFSSVLSLNHANFFPSFSVLHLVLSIFACVDWCKGRKKRRVGQNYDNGRNELDWL